MSDKVSEQNDELDSLRAELNLLSQEKESLIKALDSARAEKVAIDKNRLDISNMVNIVLKYCSMIFEYNFRVLFALHTSSLIFVTHS